MSKLVSPSQVGSDLKLKIDVWEAVTNSYGEPRLGRARDFLFPLTQDKIPLLVDVFQYWRDFDEYVAVEGEHIETGEKQYLFIKCSKRGNDVYAWRIKKRLNFLNNLRDVEFFSPEDFKPNKVVKSNLLWITLTWNSYRCSLQEAWEKTYYELHKFKANLENRYGKIEWLVFPQPFPNPNGKAFGYPHFHILMLFKEASFKVFPRLEEDKDSKMVMRYRVQEKYELEAQGKWHSFIDVQALSSPQKAAAYCQKYAQKMMYGDSYKASVTQAVNWLFRKRSFSLTREFQGSLNDLIGYEHNRKIFQAHIDGSEASPVWDWRFKGIFSAERVGVDGETWVKSVDVDEFQDVLFGGGQF